MAAFVSVIQAKNDVFRFLRGVNFIKKRNFKAELRWRGGWRGVFNGEDIDFNLTLAL